MSTVKNVDTTVLRMCSRRNNEIMYGIGRLNRHASVVQYIGVLIHIS